MTLIESAPAVEVGGPALAPYGGGLFSVVSAGPPPDVHAEAGVWWRSVGCGEVGVTYDTCTVDSEVAAKDANVVCEVNFATVFTVFARSAESMGGGTAQEKFDAARSQLLAGEQWAVERVLWEQLVAGTTPLTAGSFAEAVAMAEQHIAWNYGGQPIMHMSRFTATMASDVLAREAGRLVTTVGSPVVAGGGYGDDPPSEAAGQGGMVIASGPLVIYRSEVLDVGRTYDQSVNSIDALVERNYVVGWDCAAVAVEYTPEPAG